MFVYTLSNCALLSSSMRRMATFGIIKCKQTHQCKLLQDSLPSLTQSSSIFITQETMLIFPEQFFKIKIPEFSSHFIPETMFVIPIFSKFSDSEAAHYLTYTVNVWKKMYVI